jgi:hypothetical protein
MVAAALGTAALFLLFFLRTDNHRRARPAGL